ncbi:LOW QUALITY PROTEIN: hypothetical protein V1478_017736 [Vespula squamosa]|uniref:Uncharacterized protein n=1 Tax=Vespula squamosa TaxID=30214 RepID=A0ABD1ZWN9_VESSQ
MLFRFGDSSELQQLALWNYRGEQFLCSKRCNHYASDIAVVFEEQMGRVSPLSRKIGISRERLKPKHSFYRFYEEAHHMVPIPFACQIVEEMSKSKPLF